MGAFGDCYVLSLLSSAVEPRSESLDFFLLPGRTLSFRTLEFQHRKLSQFLIRQDLEPVLHRIVVFASDAGLWLLCRRQGLSDLEVSEFGFEDSMQRN